MKGFILLLLFFIASSTFGSDSLLVQREQQLDVLLNDLRDARSTEVKEEKNELFKEYLYETIQLDNAFFYPFDKLKTLGSIRSSDNIIRLFNWNIEQNDGSQKYYCYILRYDERRKTYKVNELIDNSIMLPPRPDGTLEAHEWYGALYYKIVPVEKGNKQMYTLLGWDGNNSLSNIKLLDVLYFAGNSPRLGSPIFKLNHEVLKRVFFEHSEKAYMSLKYEDNYKRIIFDHLSPESPSMKGFYSYYIPDLSYDAFKFEGNKWVLHEDVIGINKESPKKMFVLAPNGENGEIQRKEIKTKWIDPSDSNAPGGGFSHVAVLPEEADGKSKTVKIEKVVVDLPTRDKIKDPVSYSNFPYSDAKQKRKLRRWRRRK
jgi:hypothetical protein